jgi:phage tail tape-measure protein
MKKVALILTGAALLTGCTATQKGTLIGSAAGAGIGAIIGHQSGDRDKGAAIGALLGGAGGAVVGNKMGQKYFCPTCGRQYEEGTGSRFCPADGTELRPVIK